MWDVECFCDLRSRARARCQVQTANTNTAKQRHRHRHRHRHREAYDCVMAYPCCCCARAVIASECGLRVQESCGVVRSPHLDCTAFQHHILVLAQRSRHAKYTWLVPFTRLAGFRPFFLCLPRQHPLHPVHLLRSVGSLVPLMCADASARVPPAARCVADGRVFELPCEQHGVEQGLHNISGETRSMQTRHTTTAVSWKPSP